MGLRRSVIAANLGMLCSSMCKLWSYQYTFELMRYFPFRNQELLYILINVSPSNGSIIGAIVAYILLNTIGRKATLLCSVIPLSVGCMINVTYSTMLELIVGEVIIGIGIGVNLVTIPLYISEIATDENRGAVGVSAVIGYVIGELISGLLSTSVESTIYLMIAFTFITLYFVAIIFASESPYFAVLCRENEKARRDLIEIRGPTINVDEEMEMIKRMVRRELFRNKRCLSCLVGGNVFMFITMGLLTTVQHCTGNFTTQIFKEIICTILQMNNCNWYLGTAVASVQIICGIICMSLVDRIGRKFLLLMSACGAAIGNLLLAFSLYVLNENVFITLRSQITVIIGFLIYLLTFNIGLSAIPTMMIGELFTLNAKIKAACIFRIVTDLNTYIFLTLNHDFGYELFQDLFYIFFICAVVSIFGILFFVPKD